MNIIQDIKALFALRGAVGDLKGAYMQSGHSWLSTRFWLTATSTAATFWAAIHGFIPQPWGTVIPIVGVAIYNVVETIRKAVVDVQAAKGSAIASVVNPQV